MTQNVDYGQVVTALNDLLDSYNARPGDIADADFIAEVDAILCRAGVRDDDRSERVFQREWARNSNEMKGHLDPRYYR